jgi:urate oxidase
MTRRQREIPSICGKSEDLTHNYPTIADNTTSFVANDTQKNSIYASEKTVETIIEKYGLQTKL